MNRFCEICFRDITEPEEVRQYDEVYEEVRQRYKDGDKEMYLVICEQCAASLREIRSDRTDG